MKKIYTLENDRMYAEIVPSRGANLIKLYDKELDCDILRTPEKLEDFDNVSPYLYGTPILFPPNRISGGRFMFEGREYIFPINEPDTGCFIHGTLHQTSFTVIKHDKSRLICRYEATKEMPYLTFPNEFMLDIEYALSDDGIIQSVVITNTSSSKMPAALAFHTTFNTDFAGEHKSNNIFLQAPAIKEFERDVNYLPTGNVFTKSDYITALCHGGLNVCRDAVSAIFEVSDNGKISLINTDRKIAVCYEFGEMYKYLMLYNGNGKDGFVCIEPQTWLSNCPNAPFPREETGFSVLAPGKSCKYISTISCKLIR